MFRHTENSFHGGTVKNIGESPILYLLTVNAISWSLCLNPAYSLGFGMILFFVRELFSIFVWSYFFMIHFVYVILADCIPVFTLTSKKGFYTFGWDRVVTCFKFIYYKFTTYLTLVIYYIILLFIIIYRLFLHRILFCWAECW